MDLYANLKIHYTQGKKLAIHGELFEPIPCRDGFFLRDPAGDDYYFSREQLLFSKDELIVEARRITRNSQSSPLCTQN